MLSQIKLYFKAIQTVKRPNPLLFLFLNDGEKFVICDLALEEAYRVGQRPINVELIRNILSRSINNLEPQLARNGYNVKTLADILNLRPTEVKSFLQNQLTPARQEEIHYQMLVAGIPV